MIHPQKMATTPAIIERSQHPVNQLIQMVEQHLIKRKDPKITLFYLYELQYTGPHIKHKLAKLRKINTDIPLNQSITKIEEQYPSSTLEHYNHTEQFNTALKAIIIREEEIGHSQVNH